ncbi:lamin tail domain-containing protein [Amycolatopsis coloradensis]|uniref:Lamin tail domain-containing protein n=1 Tax=Amycolatopsis coloradensis TaxID=76021 RepID=A0ACD5BJS6_9PSEU
MKRIISALAVAASSGALMLGASTTATAAETAVQQQVPVVYISEVATRGTGPAGASQDFIEIANPSFARVPIGGLQLQAMVGQQVVTIPIPTGVVLGPRQVYTIANAAFTGCVPDQVFTENLSGNRPLKLVLGTPGGARVDAATTRPHPARLSLHRVAFTGTPNDFTPAPRTPCVLDANTPSAQ